METTKELVPAPEVEGTLELAMQELETMEAPGWDVVVSAALSMAGGISLGVAIT